MKKVIYVIIEKAKTGEGDGKIFILNLGDAIRIKNRPKRPSEPLFFFQVLFYYK